MDVKKQSFLETYEIREKLGAGSGGTIIKAYHKNLQKDVVIKKMHDSAAEVLSKRSETDALKNLRHPYIPQVLDFVELDDGIYTVMDYIPGKSFRELLESGRKFSQKEAVKYARQLFEALTYIHSQNPKVIHGDIKPDNLMLTPDDNICLIDFNISGTMDETGALIEGFSDVYSSPEQKAGFLKFKAEAERMMNASAVNAPSQEYQATQIIGADETELLTPENALEKQTEVLQPESMVEKQATSLKETLETLRTSGFPAVKIDERADVYSAAATIYHILTGQKPILQNGRVVPASSINNKISAAFSYVLEHAMEQDPDKRFQSSKDALNAINDMHKLDKRYKALVRQQNILFVIAIIFITVGISLIIHGRNTAGLEKIKKYEENISQMQDIASITAPGDTSNDDEFEELYDECISLNEKSLDAYLYQAVFLYRKKSYEQALDYIDETIYSNVNFSKQSGIETVHYIYGSSLLNKENPDYKEAITYLDKAINSGYEGSSCFRELAECYLYTGNLESADATLQSARDLELDGSDMELMAGEISAKKGDVQDAREYYMNSIELAKSEDDPEVLLRAYVGLNNVITSENKTEQSLSEAINVLDSALQDLSGGYQLQIIQSQVQNYIDAYQLAGDKTYIQNGIDLLQKSVDSGYKDYNNYINLAYLFEQNGDFDQAKEILIDLTNNYPENYIAYKRLAYLEADIQSVTVVSSRDYTIFGQYYLAAKEKYTAAEATGDLEMDFLDQMYSEAKANGWLN